MTIVNYSDEALLWHLCNNCGLTAGAANGIITDIHHLNEGKLQLSDTITQDCTVEDMLIDLRIEYNC